MSTYENHHVEDVAQLRLGAGQLAWCALMLLVILGSLGVLGIFIEDQLHPEGAPVLRLDLHDLTPGPGFDI